MNQIIHTLFWLFLTLGQVGFKKDDLFVGLAKFLQSFLQFVIYFFVQALLIAKLSTGLFDFKHKLILCVQPFLLFVLEQLVQAS